MGARLLFVGDIHLGRRPSRLPDHLREHGVDPDEMTPASTWRATVDLAVDRAARGGLDAVVLAGDVVESLEDRFEAYGHLADGVVRLAEAGIPVLGVAGNHDVHALPRLADQLPGFRLLGRGGSWERAELSAADGTRVDLVGWSFASERVGGNPLDSLAIAPTPGVPLLGVLHCDVDGGRSPYAPVPRSAFDRAPGDAWLLGHVHAPGSLSGPRPVGYLGSLVGLDPGEPGPHGPWLLHVDGPGAVRAEHLPVAAVRWESEAVELDPSSLESEASPADALFAVLRGALARARSGVVAETAALPVRALGCRLRLRGRVRHRSAIRGLLGAPESWPTETRDGVHTFVEKIVDETAPALDLEALARASDPPGLLARRLIALERDDDETRRVLRSAATRFRDVREQLRYAPLDEADAGEPVTGEDLEAIRSRLRRAGYAGLDALLGQSPGESPPEGRR